MSLSSSIYIYVIITLVILFLSILYQSILNDGDEKSYSVLLPTFVFGLCSCLCRIFWFDFRTSLLFGISVSTIFIIFIALYKISDHKFNSRYYKRKYLELRKEYEQLKKSYDKTVKQNQSSDEVKQNQPQ